ncbi:MAG: serine hydrolase domain-containing protein [Thermoanaerobaculia bacterium]
MKTWLTLALLATLTSCTHLNRPAAQDATQLEYAAQIERIENGLIEFTSPMAMFRADRPANAPLLTLSERMSHYRVPGLGVAAIQQSRLAWARSYGVLRAGAEARVTADTYFQAASTSKTVAASIVMHFVDKGLLTLDEDVNTYLRSWRVPDNPFTREKKVTLRLLLTHQAGLPSGNFAWNRDAAGPTLVQVLKGELPATNKPAVVELTPGSRWQYSNLGFVVVQQVLEDVAGKPYEQIAQEIVFRPLGMRHSTFEHPIRPPRAGEAMPHDADGTPREPQMPPTAVAQGGLMTTPSDLALFAGALMNAFHGRPNPLLSQEAARQMFHRELDLDPKMFGGPFAEGLGGFLHGEGEDLALVSPGSNLPGMNCWLIAYPAQESGVVVMTNGVQGEILAMEIIAAVRRESGAAAAVALGTQ